MKTLVKASTSLGGQDVTHLRRKKAFIGGFVDGLSASRFIWDDKPLPRLKCASVPDFWNAVGAHIDDAIGIVVVQKHGGQRAHGRD